MKELFGETMKDQIDRFVSIDSDGHCTSRRGGRQPPLSRDVQGPGRPQLRARSASPNPANAMGRAIAKIAEFQVPTAPRTTFNVGRVGGGTSVNAIPSEAWMEVDLRSSDPAALAALDARFQKAVDAASPRRTSGGDGPASITVVKELVGDRPAGSSSPTTRRSCRRRWPWRAALGFERAIQRRLDRRERADESEDSGDHDRRRRPRRSTRTRSTNRSTRPTRGRARRTRCS